MPKKKLQKIATNVNAAAAMLGYPVEIVRAAKHGGCKAFGASGRINLVALKSWLKKNSVRLDAIKGVPNYNVERAKKMEMERRSSEADFLERVGDLMKVKKMIHAIVGLCKVVQSRMRQIPDRVHQKHAMMLTQAGLKDVDALALKDDLMQEINGALRTFSEMDIKQLIKETRDAQ